MGTTTFRGLDDFGREAAGQCAYFEARSPVHARFLGEAAALLHEDTGDGAVRAAVLEAWRDRSFAARYERPLLVCAAVRFDALRDPAHPLRAALGAEPPDPSAITRDAVRASLLRPAALASMRDRFVQTNEVTRAVAWRWPLGLVAGDRRRRAVLVDLGCSAGLNLVADRIDLAWNVEVTPVDVVCRVGLDRAPVDVRDAAARGWLEASIWPGQTERLVRFGAACDRLIEARARGELALEACDAAAMPARLDAITREAPEGAVVCAYQTVLRDYLPADVLVRYESGLRDWLLAHPDRALWCELEQAPRGSKNPAEIRVHVVRHRSVRTLALASGEFHPATVEADARAVRFLESPFLASE